MRERPPISANAGHADVILHIDQLHTCLDITGEKVDKALDRLETMEVTQQKDRHKARNRDMALLGGLEILLRERGYEMEYDEDGGLSRMSPPAPQSLWAKAAPAATVIGTVLGALSAYKGIVFVLGTAHHLLAAVH